MNFAIYRRYDTDIVENIVKMLPKGSRTVVFCAPTDNADYGEGTEKVFFPEDIDINTTRARNWIIEWARKNIGKGYLHVIEDAVKIDKDPAKMVADVEKLMDIFSLDTWFNTFLDPMNFVFSKYNPIFSLKMDEEGYKDIFDGSISYCTNANTCWIAYNLESCPGNLAFDERFSVPMYFIVEFMARRRNSKVPGSINYMNAYPTVSSEIEVLSLLPVKEKKVSKEEFMENHKLFSSLNVQKDPDIDVEKILMDTVAVLRGKVESPKSAS